MQSPVSIVRAAAFAALFLVALGAARAQSGSQVEVSARLSTGLAKLGSSDVRLVVEVRVEGAGTATAQIEKLPQVDGLRLGPIGNPSTKDQITLVNRLRTISRTFSWVIPIQTTRKGEFTIPPIGVVAGGRRLLTRELPLKVVEDLEGEELGFFELDAPQQVFEGEPFLLELRFGWDLAIDGSINYANLILPWLGELPGVVELDAPGIQGSTIDLGLNSRTTIRAEPIAPKEVGGGSFRMLRIRRRFLAARPGELAFPTSHLEFGQTQAADVFGMRQAEPRRRYFKRFPAFSIDVQSLPEEGRPLDFSGAVGSFRVVALPDRRDVDVGDSIKLSVEWTGNGNLEFFEPPEPTRYDAFESFRVYGKTDRKSWDRRVVVYDLAPISPDVREIPPLPLRVFDTTKKEYVSVETEPIPIHVRPLKKGGGLAEAPEAKAPELDIRDIQTEPESAGRLPAPSAWSVGAALALVPLAWLGLRTAVRRRGDPDAPRERARRAARKVLRRELERAGTASTQARALERFLAARSGESAQAWVGRDVVRWAREESAGRLALEDARALADVQAELDARTYAGRDEPLDRSSLLAVADRVTLGGL